MISCGCMFLDVVLVVLDFIKMGDLKVFPPKESGRLFRFSFRLVTPETLLASLIVDTSEIPFLWPFPLGQAEGSLARIGRSKRLSRSGVRYPPPGARGS